MRKLKLFVVALLLTTFIVKAETPSQPCDSVQIKIFGVVILEKFYGDCSDRYLPDGKWDWFPN